MTIATTNDGINFTSACGNSPALSVTVNSILGILSFICASNGVVGTAFFPAIYDPELKAYCQLKGQLIKSKGSVEETLINPL